MTDEFDFRVIIDTHSFIAYIKSSAKVFSENYGEDADGNRGQAQTTVEDLELWIEDGRGNDIFKKLIEKYPARYAQIIIKAHDRLVQGFDNQGEDDWDQERYCY